MLRLTNTFSPFSVKVFTIKPQHNIIFQRVLGLLLNFDPSDEFATFSRTEWLVPCWDCKEEHNLKKIFLLFVSAYLRSFYMSQLIVLGSLQVYTLDSIHQILKGVHPKGFLIDNLHKQNDNILKIWKKPEKSTLSSFNQTIYKLYLSNSRYYKNATHNSCKYKI